MKRPLFTFAICMALTSVFGQSADRKFAFGINGGLSDYHGELNQKWFNVNKAYRGQLGLSGNYYLNPWFNLGLDVTVGKLGFHLPNNMGYRSDMGQANLNLKFKFNNGKWIKEDAVFQPYIFIGTGFAHYLKDKDNLNIAGTDWTGNAGLGFNIMVNEKFGFNYNLNYAYTSRDYRDHRSNGKYNDQFMIHTIGVLFPLGKTKDTDGDGVGDRRDKCANTPAGVSVDIYGCPLDKDKDGIPDYQDKCPDIAGISSMNGCPDTDGDGITDAEDACPKIAGVSSAKGCPDADGDGIQDSEDACPNVKGLASMKGCPDADGDGVTDAEDACPKVKGLAQFKGCPDTDGDGVPDNEDKCPKIAGVASNNGCPEIKAETLKVFERALKGIQFETGKDVIKKTSFAVLDNVVKIMKENPSYQLEINGHTDSQGDDAKNMVLSQKRAEAVEAYLVKKGIETERLHPTGFGETKPKASNDTKEGRSENRRVEFVVKFSE